MHDKIYYLFLGMINQIEPDYSVLNYTALLCCIFISFKIHFHQFRNAYNIKIVLFKTDLPFCCIENQTGHWQMTLFYMENRETLDVSVKALRNFNNVTGSWYWKDLTVTQHAERRRQKVWKRSNRCYSLEFFQQVESEFCLWTYWGKKVVHRG